MLFQMKRETRNVKKKDNTTAMIHTRFILVNSYYRQYAIRIYAFSFFDETKMSLQTLPTELFYQIFDYLDIQTLVCSLRYVCRRLFSLTNSYDRYNFNFQSISKTKFSFICRLIPFEQVATLLLSNRDETNGEIEHFFSLFHLEQFPRLRSLTLQQIDDNQLNQILNSIQHSTIKSLSIDSKIISIKRTIYAQLLSEIIRHRTLENLDLHMWSNDINAVQWSMNSTLINLRIRTSLSMNQFYSILQQSPSLKTILFKDFDIDEKLTNERKRQFFQLKSLTCEYGRVDMSKLEQILTFIPAIEHLKLIGMGNLFNSSFDGQRWEYLIQKYLVHLKDFQFSISTITPVNIDTEIIEQLIEFFRTRFWLEQNRYIIQYDYIHYQHKLLLNSLPICQHSFEYYSNSDRISISNRKQETEQSIMMERVNRLELNLTRIMTDDVSSELVLLFRNIRELKLNIDGIWPKGSIKFLSTTIDLLQITNLSLSINFFHEYMRSIVIGTKKLLQHAVNIQSLTLMDLWGPDHCTTTVEFIQEMLTTNIRQLDIRVKNTEDMKYLIENIEHLQMIHFHFPQNLGLTRDVLVDRLLEVNRHVSIWNCERSLYVWLDRN